MILDYDDEKSELLFCKEEDYESIEEIDIVREQRGRLIALSVPGVCRRSPGNVASRSRSRSCFPLRRW